MHHQPSHLLAACPAGLHPTWMTFFSPNLGGLWRLSLPRSAEPTQRQRLGSLQNSRVELRYCWLNVNSGRCSRYRCTCPWVPTRGHMRWTHVCFPLQGMEGMIPRLQQSSLPCQQDCCKNQDNIFFFSNNINVQFSTSAYSLYSWLVTNAPLSVYHMQTGF